MRREYPREYPTRNVDKIRQKQLIAIKAELKEFLPKLKKMNSRYEKKLYAHKLKAAEGQYLRMKKAILAFYVKLLKKGLLLNHHDTRVKFTDNATDQEQRFEFLTIVSIEIANLLDLEEDDIEDLAHFVMTGLVPHIDYAPEDFLITFESYFKVSGVFLN